MRTQKYLRISLLLALPLLIAPESVFACQSAESLVFSCATTKNKMVEVCDAGSTINYSYGRKGASPELALSIPRNQASTFQWNGIGRYINYRVSVPNGATVYTVFTSLDKLSTKGPRAAGIDVETKGDLVATLQCKPGSVQEHLEGVNLKPTED